MVKAFRVVIEDCQLIFCDENLAYQEIIETINDDLEAYLHLIRNNVGIVLQPIKSKNCINTFKEITDFKEAYEYYKSNIDNIYNYFYNGGNEGWETFLYSNISIEELCISD